MVIYVDEIFAVNSISCALLLTSYAILAGTKLRILKTVSSAVLCGGYAAADAVFGLPQLLRLPLLVLLLFIAFGRRRLIKNTAFVMLLSGITECAALALSCMFGGNAVLACGHMVMLANEPITFSVYLLTYPIILLARRIYAERKKYKHIELVYNGHRAEFDALYDSGNLLKYHGLPVIFTDWQTASSLIEHESYGGLMDSSSDFVMYGTVGGGGVLPVILPDICRADGKETQAAVAVTERGFNGKYHGIINT